MQQIKFTDGCPNGCEYCYEPKVQPKNYLPDIPYDDIQILDMNFLSNEDALKLLYGLPPRPSYEFVCGIDYRRLTQEICYLLKQKGFIKIRWAWDYGFSQQKIHKATLEMLKKAGYRSKDLSIFILSNWKISFKECCRKLDLLKVWNVKVNDCCYDGGYHIKNLSDYQANQNPKNWSYPSLKMFRMKCRKHNQMVLFGIDPELKC